VRDCTPARDRLVTAFRFGFHGTCKVGRSGPATGRSVLDERVSSFQGTVCWYVQQLPWCRSGQICDRRARPVVEICHAQVDLKCHELRRGTCSDPEYFGNNMQPLTPTLDPAWIRLRYSPAPSDFIHNLTNRRLHHRLPLPVISQAMHAQHGHILRGPPPCWRLGIS
jgi:hypothetical protein